jgi:DNA polymerase-3 subunit alpha
MKPNRIEDLIAANALYRPGPMEYIPDYVDAQARKAPPYRALHETCREFTGATYGIMVYQEQVMQRM